MTDAKILIVEDDELSAAHLEECLENLGYTVCDSVSCGREAIEKAADKRPDLALVNLGLEGKATGLETAEHIGSQFDVPVVYLTDEAEEDLLQQAQATNPFGYVLKPFEKRQLHLNIQTAVSMHERETRHRKTEMRLKRIIKRLKDFTRLMKTVFDSMSEGVIAVDENRKLVFHNSVARRFGEGLPVEGDIDKWAENYGVFQPDGKTLVPKDENPLKLALSGKATDGFEVMVSNDKMPEGVHAHISISGRPLRGKAGALKGGVLVFRDITRLQHTEVELERTIAEQKDQALLMETILSSISDGVLVANTEGEFTFFNPSAEQIAGGILDLKAGQWTENYGVFYSDKKNRMPTEQLPLMRAVRGEATDNVEMFVRNENKPSGYHISVSGRPLRTNVGGHGGGVVVFRDITKQKKAAAELEKTIEELRKQSELMETMFNSISDGIVVADVTGQSFYVNPAAGQITGMDITDCPPEEWVERYGLFYPDRETPMRMEDLPFLRIISHGESMDEVDMFIRNHNRPDGVYIRVSGRPLLDNLGGIRGGVIIFRDVTERMLAEEALAQAFAQGRLEVMDTILHNIGNAINSVTTGIETVRQHLGNDYVGRRLFALASAVREHQDDWVDYVANDPQGREVMPFIIELSESFSKRNEELTKTVGRVRDRATHIAEIVRTQKAFGSPTMTRKDIDLHDALSAAIRVLRDSLNQKGIHTDIDCENAPREICIEESQFHQMLVNLVKNSIEAIDDLTVGQGLDEPPRIQIRASAEGDFLNLEVSDNGIGIKSRDTKAIFTPGYTTKNLGSGLGLHSAANFVIAAGGRIEALSKGIGKGTTMRVRLPLSSVASQNGRDVLTNRSGG
ncbi:MAG: PAS domain S-box protein [Gemmatimonadota bacterium]|nr:PAS domain S-box protein [Gemmatimonadota bacterium]